MNWSFYNHCLPIVSVVETITMLSALPSMNSTQEVKDSGLEERLTASTGWVSGADKKREINRNEPLFFIPKVQRDKVVFAPIHTCSVCFLKWAQSPSSALPVRITCRGRARSFGKTRTHTLTQKHNSRSLCGTVLCIGEGEHKERFLCSIFGRRDSGSFHVALTQTHTGWVCTAA